MQIVLPGSGCSVRDWKTRRAGEEDDQPRSLSTRRPPFLGPGQLPRDHDGCFLRPCERGGRPLTPDAEERLSTALRRPLSCWFVTDVSEFSSSCVSSARQRHVAFDLPGTAGQAEPGPCRVEVTVQAGDEGAQFRQARTSFIHCSKRSPRSCSIMSAKPRTWSRTAASGVPPTGLTGQQTGTHAPSATGSGRGSTATGYGVGTSACPTTGTRSRRWERCVVTVHSTASPRLRHGCQRSATWMASGAPRRVPSA